MSIGALLVPVDDAEAAAAGVVLALGVADPASDVGIAGSGGSFCSSVAGGRGQGYSAGLPVLVERFIAVRALRAGFRRGGRAWSDVETVVAVAEFSDEQLAQIEAEPLLVVREVTRLPRPRR